MHALLGMRELAAKLKKRQERALASIKKNLRSHGALYLRLMKMKPGSTIQHKRHAITLHHDGTYTVQWMYLRQKDAWKEGAAAPALFTGTAMGAANFLFPEGEFISTLREETGR